MCPNKRSQAILDRLGMNHNVTARTGIINAIIAAEDAAYRRGVADGRKAAVAAIQHVLVTELEVDDGH